MKTFIDVATTICNLNQHLRLAPSVGTAKSVASLVAEEWHMWPSGKWFESFLLFLFIFGFWLDSFLPISSCGCNGYHPLEVIKWYAEILICISYNHPSKSIGPFPFQSKLCCDSVSNIALKMSIIVSCLITSKKLKKKKISGFMVIYTPYVKS